MAARFKADHNRWGVLGVTPDHVRKYVDTEIDIAKRGGTPREGKPRIGLLKKERGQGNFSRCHRTGARPRKSGGSMQEENRVAVFRQWGAWGGKGRPSPHAPQEQGRGIPEDAQAHKLRRRKKNQRRATTTTISLKHKY